MVAWRAEGGAYRNSPIKMTSTAGLERFDLGALIVVSKEVLEDESFNAEATIRDQLVKALAAQLDADFISPSNSGTGGTKPPSITSGAGANASPTESMFDFSDAFSGVPNNAWIVINPWQAARLYGAARPDISTRDRSRGGVPVLTSTAMPEGQFALVDPDQIAVALGEADVRASDHAMVDMQDLSSMTSGPSVAAATGVSMFQVNCRDHRQHLGELARRPRRRRVAVRPARLRPSRGRLMPYDETGREIISAAAASTNATTSSASRATWQNANRCQRQRRRP